MVMYMMADSVSDFYVQSDTFGQKKVRSSFFSIHGYIVGFSSKGSSDADSVRSPTSPLDFKAYVTFSNPFTVKSLSLTPQTVNQKKWDCSKVGLGIINSLADENKSTGEVLESSKRKNIVFGPQVKTNIPSPSRHYHELVNPCMKSSSLPRNYMISSVSQTKMPEARSGGSNGVTEHGVPLEPATLKSSASCLFDSTRFCSSLAGSAQKQNLSSKPFNLTDRTTIMSSPALIDGSSQMDTSLGPKPSSLPIPIGSGNGHVGSLSAREIELSEDYTCIISHGPNRKTTRIFGDCILECQTQDLANFVNKGEQGVETPQVARTVDGSALYPSDEFLSFCYSCKKKLERGADIYMYRGEKAFCSFDCRSEEIFAEEEIEKTYDNSSKSSPGSSYNEDLFLSGMPINT